jgi:hypothetical protein
MSVEPNSDLQLEIGYLLLIDVVGYSKLLVNEQVEVLQELNRIVRSTPSFRMAEANGKLIRLPTGDGMALIFFRSPEEPAQCALEIHAASKSQLHLQLRMGVHSGPVNQISDVNDRSNVAGTGINVAQRVMDCGDAGHILLSQHVADDLAQYRHWQPYLHDLGHCSGPPSPGRDCPKTECHPVGCLAAWLLRIRPTREGVASVRSAGRRTWIGPTDVTS